jgi:hypothetical protein
MKEIRWEPIPGFDCKLVSDTGEVKTTVRGENKVLAQNISDGGYPCISLWNGKRNKSIKVHRLVAASFVKGFAYGMQVNHIDGNNKNNRADNLEWVTPKQNTQHAIKIGLIKGKGENHNRAKLTQKEVDRIREYHKIDKISYSNLARIFGVSFSQIGKIIRNENWLDHSLTQ